MQLTLHTTDKCNLRCKYCFVPRSPQSMTLDVAKAAVKFGMANAKMSGLLFYGGEPLLEKQLIIDTVNYAKSIKEETGHNFYYKITTNGTLLDREFLEFSRENNIAIGFSHDGPAQDICRVFTDGSGSAAVLEEKIAQLLEYQPYAVAMSVLDPSTVHMGADIVKFFYSPGSWFARNARASAISPEKGFRYIHVGVNYSRDAGWTNDHLKILAREYTKMGKLYLKWTRQEKKIYLSPFDMKILSHLKGEKYNGDRLKMMHNQPSVATNGDIFYSSKHLNDPDYKLGDVFNGMDTAKQKAIYAKSYIPSEPCKNCAIITRCNYAYDCMGGEILPMQCAHEQVITPIVDRVAETLYKENNAMFKHKHYNELYPILSLIEDRN